MRDGIMVALAKGRLAKDALDIFADAGLSTEIVDLHSRKLVFNGQGISYILVKPSDVPIYVYHGVADIGVVGKDTLLEANLPLYEMLDLGLGACKLSIAGFPNTSNSHSSRSVTKCVATKYPNIARQFYEAKGENIDIIELHGSVELGPLVGLSDVILDIVESGSTLKANDLCVLEDVCDISARLVVNPVSLKTKQKVMHDMIERVAAQLEKR